MSNTAVSVTQFVQLGEGIERNVFLNLTQLNIEIRIKFN